MKRLHPVTALLCALALGCGGTSPNGGPTGPETCDNGKDDNGDGKTDCADPKCFSSPKCRVAVERCDNGVDDDSNGQTDCLDLACQGGDCGFGCTCNNMARTESACSDQQDNDGDNLVDCGDPDCAQTPPCGGSAGGGNGGTGGGNSSGTGGGNATGGGVSGSGGGVSGSGGGVSGSGGGAPGSGGGVAGTGGGVGTNLADGAACTADNQCAGGRCLTEAQYGFPRGMCTNADNAPCTVGPSNVGCHGGRCIAGAPNRCRPACTGTGLSGPTACRAGYACADLDNSFTKNICISLCTNDSECAGSNGVFGCNLMTHFCENKNFGKLGYGARCTADTQCESGYCYNNANFPGGYCMGLCRGDLGNSSCGTNGHCLFLNAGDNIGECYMACASVGSVCRVETEFDYKCYSDGATGNLCACRSLAQSCLETNSMGITVENPRRCCSGRCGTLNAGFCDP